MKKSLVILLIAALCLAMSVAVCVYAATAGSESDPVVTKSYIDKVIADLKSNGGGGGGSFAAVGPFSKGTVIVGGEGTEMILRSGSAVAAIPSTAGGGISDLTSGTDIKNGKAITLNHLLLFARPDGRAIKITKDGAYIMIKGDYTAQ